MAITDQNLSTSVWDAVRTKLVSGNIVVTNSSTSATTAATINASYNDKAVTKPQVSLYPIDSDETFDKFSTTEGKKIINVIVDCTYKNSLGADQLYDQVCYLLKQDDVVGIDLIGLTTNFVFQDPTDAKYHIKSATFSYGRE